MTLKNGPSCGISALSQKNKLKNEGLVTMVTISYTKDLQFKPTCGH